MRAMVLAAGVGSRLDPLTRNLPKPMVPIVNKPALVHIIELLASHGIKEVVINLHHLGEKIEGFLGTGEQLGVKIFYSREESLLGIAGGVKKAAQYFDETFVVIGGDDLTTIDISKLIARHREKQALATIALARVEDPSPFGIVLIDQDNRITDFAEKPSVDGIFSNTVNTQVYVLEPEIMDLIPEGKVYDFARDLYPDLLKKKLPFYGFPISESEYWCDVGNLEQYRQVHYDALARRVRLNFPHPEVGNRVWIGEQVEIHPSARIGERVMIGNRCRIAAGAQVLEDSVLGEDCVVEENSVISQSILWEGAHIQKDTFLEGCVVGSHCQAHSNAGIFNGVIVPPQSINGTGESP